MGLSSYKEGRGASWEAACVFYEKDDPFPARTRVDSTSPGIAYLTVTALALMVIALTGHLDGILSGVETP